VAVAVGVAVDVALAVGVGVGDIVAVAVAVGVGLIVAVAVGVGVDVGVGVPPIGAWIDTEIPVPSFLKKYTSAPRSCGGACASNRKLYNVPQRIAFAFWFCANVSLFQVMESLV
jgi:hypothetical protein